VTGNENVKIVYAHIFVKSGSTYVKPRPKSPAHATQCRRIHFISRKDSFLW